MKYRNRNNDIEDFELIIWDWKEQIPTKELNFVVRKGYKFFYEVDSGSDSMVLVCLKQKARARYAQTIWNWWDDKMAGEAEEEDDD